MAEIVSKKDLQALPIVAYQDIRSELKTGDLFFSSGGYLFSGVIQKLTKSTWSHVAVIYKDEELGRVLVLEAEPFVGVRMIPLSKYLKDYKGKREPYKGQIVLAKLAHPLSKEEINSGISFGLDELTRPYDNVEIVRIMVRILLRISKRATNRSYICSELVRDILAQSNLDMPYMDTYISPDHVWHDARVKFHCRIL
jgi:hypothetical protein